MFWLSMEHMGLSARDARLRMYWLYALSEGLPLQVCWDGSSCGAEITNRHATMNRLVKASWSALDRTG